MKAKMRLFTLAVALLTGACTDQAYKLGLRQKTRLVALKSTPSRNLVIETEFNQNRPKVPVVFIIDDSNSVKQNSMANMKTAIQSFTSQLRGYNFDVHMYTTSLTPMYWFGDGNRNAATYVNTRYFNASHQRVSGGYYDHITYINPAARLGGFDVDLQLYPSFQPPAYKTDTLGLLREFPSAPYRFTDTNTDLEFTSKLTLLSNELSQYVIGGGELEQSFITAGLALTDQAKVHLRSTENIFGDDAKSGVLVFLSDEDNYSRDDNSIVHSQKMTITEESRRYEPTFKSNATWLRFRPLIPWVVDGNVDPSRLNISGHIYDIEVRDASFNPKAFNLEFMPGEFCRDGVKSGLFATWSAVQQFKTARGYSDAQAAAKLEEIKSLIREADPLAYLGDNVKDFQIFCSPQNATELTPHLTYRIPTAQGLTPCTGGVVNNNHGLIPSAAFNGHWLYHFHHDLVPGAPCNTFAGYEAKNPENVVTLAQALSPVQTTLKDAMLDRIQQRFGEKFLIGAFIKTQAAGCSLTGSVGTQYIDLIRGHAGFDIDPKKGFVRNICNTSEFVLGGDTIANFIKMVSVNQYNVTLNADESIRAVSIERGSQIISVTPDQYTLEDGVLNFSENILQVGDKLRIALDRNFEEVTFE